METKRKSRQENLNKINFKTKSCHKRQRMILHNDQGINPRRKCKVVNIHTPQYKRQMLTAIKWEITIITQ